MVVNSASHNSEPTLAQLVSGLMSDATLLVHQELALAKYELYEEARKTKTAVASLGAGIGIAAIGGLLLDYHAGSFVERTHRMAALDMLWNCWGYLRHRLELPCFIEVNSRFLKLTSSHNKPLRQ